MAEEVADLLRKYGCKVQTVLYHLPGYSFFHGPSSVGDLDDRLIGRVHLYKRLKMLLTEAKSRNGTYLVTGYRGVGKTSLVSSVLTELTARTSPRWWWRQFALLATFLATLHLPVAFLGAAQSPLLAALPLLYPLLLLLAIVALLVLLEAPSLFPSAGDPSTSPHSRNPSTHRPARFLRLYQHLFLDEYRTPRSTLGRLAEDLLRSMSLYTLALLLSFGRLSEALHAPLAYSLLAACLVIPVRILARMARRPVVEAASKLARARTWERIHEMLRSATSRQHTFAVPINFGQDQLGEAEVLRLVAQSVRRSYADYCCSWPNRALVWLAMVGLLFLASRIHTRAQPYEKTFLQQSRVVFFLPSLVDPWLSRPQSTSPHASGSPVGVFDYYQARAQQHVKPDEIYRTLARDCPSNPFCLPQPSSSTYTKDRPLAPKASPPLLSPFAEGVAHYTVLFDRVVVGILHWGRETLRSLGLSWLVPLVPFLPPYWVSMYFCCLLLLLRVLGATLLVGRPTRRSVRRRLASLWDRISAQVKLDDQVSAGSPRPQLPFFLGRVASRSYPLATPRDIERELLEIFEDIERLPGIFSPPLFVFVFDELDKVEPRKNLTVAEIEAEDDDLLSNKAAFSSYERSRERQHQILAALSNLKFFFSSVKAKSIFIAGREMYDVSLADISDRHFFMGSLFNEVIYVPSFLSDPSDGKLAEVTSFTETFVCSRLLPPGTKDPSLRRVREDLDRKLRGGKQLDDEAERRLRYQLDKALFLLRDFIIYLTYRSNGAPKKLIALFESYVTRTTGTESEFLDVFWTGPRQPGLYLCFTFNDQLALGLVAHLASPLFLSLHREIKDFGDKLLVSGAFLLDHIYKFHATGFSHRSLELLPELLDINRAPQLREVIARVIRSLQGRQLNRIATGIFDFRFHKRIVEEISYISRVSEREAAAFNFTLDESIAAKRHYRKELKKILELYSPYKDAAQKGELVHSLAFLRMILGDLHFFDQEYDQAIVEYLEAVQALQGLDPEHQSLHRIALLVRNLLKLGLAHEKKRSFDSAFITYTKVTSVLMQFRHIDPEKLDLAELSLDWPLSEDDSLDSDRSLLVHRKTGARLGERSSFSDIVRRLPFSPFRGQINERLAALSGLRLLIQPLIAKLAVAEKSHIGGAKIDDLQRVLEEFNFLLRLNDRAASAPIRAEFMRRIGDVFYYKNGPVPTAGSLTETGTRKERYATPHCTKTSGGCAPNQRVHDLFRKGFRAPCVACELYVNALREMSPSLSLDGASPSLVAAGLARLAEPSLASVSAGILAEASLIFSSLGNAFLGCAQLGSVSPARPAFLSAVASVCDETMAAAQKAVALGQLEGLVQIGAPGDVREPPNKLEEALACCVLASELALRSGNPRESSLQLSKILHILRLIVVSKTKLEDDFRSAAKTLSRNLFPTIARRLFLAYDSSHRLEISAVKAQLGSGDEPRGSAQIDLNGVTLNLEVQEIVALAQEIGSRLESKPSPAPWDQEGSPYRVVSSAYNRIYQIRLRAHSNHKAYKRLLTEPWPRQTSRKWFLILDSVFALNSAASSLAVYDQSYMASHLQRAVAHEHLAYWCAQYDAQVRPFAELVLDGDADAYNNICSLALDWTTAVEDFKLRHSSSLTGSVAHALSRLMCPHLALLGEGRALYASLRDCWLSRDDLWPKASAEWAGSAGPWVDKLRRLVEPSATTFNSVFKQLSAILESLAPALEAIGRNPPPTRALLLDSRHGPLSAEEFIGFFGTLLLSAGSHLIASMDKAYLASVESALSRIDAALSSRKQTTASAQAALAEVESCWRRLSVELSRLRKRKAVTAHRRPADLLSELLGDGDSATVNGRFHLETAKLHLHRSVSAHKEGQTYREIISRMTALSDDLGDQLTHLCCALERLQINSGLVDERLERIETKLTDSSLFNLASWTKHPEDRELSPKTGLSIPARE